MKRIHFTFLLILIIIIILFCPLVFAKSQTRPYPINFANTLGPLNKTEQNNLFNSDRYKQVKSWCIDSYDKINIEMELKGIEWSKSLTEKSAKMPAELPKLRGVLYEANQYASTFNIFKTGNDSSYFLHKINTGLSFINQKQKNPWFYKNSYGKEMYIQEAESFNAKIRSIKTFTYYHDKNGKCDEKRIVVRGTVKFYRKMKHFDTFYVLDELVSNTTFGEPLKNRRISIYSDLAKSFIHGTNISEDKEINNENKKNLFPEKIIFIGADGEVTVSSSKNLKQLWEVIEKIPVEFSY